MDLKIEGKISGRGSRISAAEKAKRQEALEREGRTVEQDGSQSAGQDKTIKQTER